MEDSFRVRVDKAFGSLASSSETAAAPSTNLSSLWSLTDDEIERHQWNRRDLNSPEPELEPDSFLFKKGFLSGNREKSEMDFKLELENDLDQLDDEDDDEESRASSKPDDYNDEEWEIKNSIGLDCTLDFEEEEDQYDKVAVGKEKPGDRLYMKDISQYYGMNVNCSNNELPNSLNDVARDPRANHFAAKLRLKEDAEAAKKMDSLRVSEQNSPAIVDSKARVSEDGNLKSILKRRDNESDSKWEKDRPDSKVQKRVRFDPECKDGSDKESDDVDTGTDSEDKSLVYPLPPDYPSGIPDYMRNPSKYTHYTFDSSSDVDEQSNRQAFADLMKMLKKSDDIESEQDGVPGELPKSLTFIPKRKFGDAEVPDTRIEPKRIQGNDVMKEPLRRKGAPISIAAAHGEDNGPGAMEEDEPERVLEKRNNSQRASRKYRTKARLETEDSV